MALPFIANKIIHPAIFSKLLSFICILLLYHICIILVNLPIIIKPTRTIFLYIRIGWLFFILFKIKNLIFGNRRSSIIKLIWRWSFLRLLLWLVLLDRLFYLLRRISIWNLGLVSVCFYWRFGYCFVVWELVRLPLGFLRQIGIGGRLFRLIILELSFV
jgi:hypothetical protein